MVRHAVFLVADPNEVSVHCLDDNLVFSFFPFVFFPDYLLSLLLCS